MGDSQGFRPFDVVARAARNSPWLLIAAAAHVVVLAGAAVFFTAYEPPELAPDETIAFRPNAPRVDETIEVPAVPPIRVAPPPADPFELTPFDPEQYVVDELAPDDLTQEVGDPLSDALAGEAGGSSAIGVGEGGIRRPNPSPTGGRGFDQRNRTGKTPNKRLERHELAVLEGLRWLARHQNEDGSWSAATLNDVCPCDEPAYHAQKPAVRHYDTGLTSLALLAFLGAGHTHLSQGDLVDTTRQKRHKIGSIVKKGLQWLTQRQNPDGSFTPDRPFLYNEALATMALSEAYGLSQSRYFREPAQRALAFLERAQRPSPTGTGLWGWRYASREEIERFHRGAGSLDAEAARDLYDADTSVTGWAVMALKSGQLSGLAVSRASLEGGVAFTEHVIQRDADGRPTGLVGYLDAQGAGAKVTGPNDQFHYPAGTMSALAMCIRIFAQRDLDDPFLRPAAAQIVKDLPRVTKDGLSVDYYSWYYAALALNQLDGPDAPRRTGKYWPAWNQAMLDALLPLQSKDARSCASGGWMQPDRWSIEHGGPLYATAINVLTLEVYYRYENAFGGKKRN